MFKRISALSIKEFIHLKNDWWLPVFMLFGGVLELLLVGWATSRPITNLPMLVLDQDKSPSSRQIITALENTGTFKLKDYASNEEEIKNALVKGDVTAAVVIPAGFEAELKAIDGNPVLPVFLNGAESIPAKEALGAVEGVVRQMGQQVMIDKLNLDPAEFAGFDPSLRVWFNQSLSEAHYTIRPS